MFSDHKYLRDMENQNAKNIKIMIKTKMVHLAFHPGKLPLLNAQICNRSPKGYFFV